MYMHYAHTITHIQSEQRMKRIRRTAQTKTDREKPTSLNFILLNALNTMEHCHTVMFLLAHN